MNLSEHQEVKLQAKGHIHWIDKKSNNIYKIYKKFNLLDDLKDIEKRLSQIVKLSYSMDFMPQTNYSYKDDLILDPFLGSGTTSVAAKQLNRNYVGYEINKEYIDIANKRLETEVN